MTIKNATMDYIHAEEKEFLGTELNELFPETDKQICGYESSKIELLNGTVYEDWIDAAFYSCLATWDMSPSNPVETMLKTKTFEEKEQMVLTILKKRPISAALESAIFTFKITGVPRTFLAQITRHRQMSFGVQSLRVSSCYGAEVRAPQVLFDDPTFENMDLLGEYENTVKQCKAMYKKLIENNVPMEQARSIMPMGTCTKMTAVMRLKDIMTYARDRTSAISQDEHTFLVMLLLKEFKNKAPKFYENFVKHEKTEELMSKYLTR